MEDIITGYIVEISLHDHNVGIGNFIDNLKLMIDDPKSIEHDETKNMIHNMVLWLDCELYRLFNNNGDIVNIHHVSVDHMVDNRVYITIYIMRSRNGYDEG